MAKLSFDGNPLMTEELFKEAMSSDFGIQKCAFAHGYCEKGGREKGKYVNYPSWLDVHDISEEQIAFAKKEFERRKKEEINALGKGDLAFVAMGGDFTSHLEDGIGNHRFRGDFKNSDGEQFFVEFCLSANEETLWIDFSIDRALEKKYEEECAARYEFNKGKRYGEQNHERIPQYYYNAKGVEKDISKLPATYHDVLDFINKTYGCDYKTCKLFRFFVSPDDYVSYC